MERHFACTACGHCCVGVLPLTLDEAIAHAGRFPLAVLLTPVRQGHRSFAITTRLGATIRLDRRRDLAVRISPVSYLPAAMACPERDPGGLCAIHPTKPLRCRTMPFYPQRDETDQAAMLVPRPGWACDVSTAAPAVYRDKTILDRAAFDAELRALADQATRLRAFAENLVATVPNILDKLVAAAANPVGGDLLVGFAPLLRQLDGVDRAEFAQRQRPVLAAFVERTASDPALAAFHRHYAAGLRDMERLARP
ncbi:YkgJ family cysteine cluster protein [Magnetospirillum molischianum]|uniref:Uncharacterized protein n=1 Tax=Magnetospirillum molischianum DSM 120 TaxID=1150626 RepID=H8FS11_MAGML|nr:YkgJ family cysteine cluster protein [Magnetospirillum molischianum]CCG41149.1 conserved hypothetical protein [Magnetospirillum molischianum DSM 120]